MDIKKDVRCVKPLHYTEFEFSSIMTEIILFYEVMKMR